MKTTAINILTLIIGLSLFSCSSGEQTTTTDNVGVSAATNDEAVYLIDYAPDASKLTARFSEELNVTDRQISRLKEINEQRAIRLNNAYERMAAGGSRSEFEAEAGRIEKWAQDQYSNVLNESQFSSFQNDIMTDASEFRYRAEDIEMKMEDEEYKVETNRSELKDEGDEFKYESDNMEYKDEGDEVKVETDEYEYKDEGDEVKYESDNMEYKDEGDEVKVETDEYEYKDEGDEVKYEDDNTEIQVE